MALWTTSEVAEEIAMSEDYVREHAAELGGIRTGGPRSPLRFDPSGVEDWKQRRRLPPPPPRRRSHRPGPRRAPRGVELVALPADR
ncbi:MAG TPA: hypothetical protein VLC07_02075 [Solirubrobacterales bacterium]|nr:hypothetical protein [Solirubrobacterales bacterium]